MTVELLSDSVLASPIHTLSMLCMDSFIHQSSLLSYISVEWRLAKKEAQHNSDNAHPICLNDNNRKNIRLGNRQWQKTSY